MAQGEAVSAPDDTRRTLADAALARAACATPAPWRVDDGEVIAADEPDVPSGYSARVVIVDRGDAADLDFIAHAREDVPALAAEVLRLRAERDALRGIVVRLAGDDGMYSDDYGMHCLCGFKRDHGDGCLRAEAQALLGGER